MIRDPERNFESLHRPPAKKALQRLAASETLADVAFDEFRKSSRKFLSRGARFRPSTDAWGVG
jgi:hypothetical protein